MLVKVFSFNLQKNKLSKAKEKYLSLLFREAKWYYNYLINLSQKQVTNDFGNLVYCYNLFNLKTNQKFIKRYNPKFDCFEDYELKALSSQMKQTILESIQNNIKALSSAKTKGRKAGKLKFKSSVPIPLKQLNFTYYLSDNLRKLSIQGNRKTTFHLTRNKNINKLSTALGFNQVNLKSLLGVGALELANAQLVRNSQNQITFNLTCYVKPEALAKANLFQGFKLTHEEKQLFAETTIGIDANIGDEYVFNLGDKFSALALDTRKDNAKYLKKIKSKQRKLNKFISKAKKKGIRDFQSRQYYSLKKQLNKAQDKLNNQKANQVKKIIAFTKCFKQTTFQHELIKVWHANKAMKFSRKVQSGTLGKAYAQLKLLNKAFPLQYKKISQKEATTKTCICGKKNSYITLKHRTYYCSCGYTNQRDIHSSYIINHYDEMKGCGIQPWKASSFSNQEKMKASVRVDKAVTVLLNKIKSQNCKALAYNPTPEALSFTAG